MADTDSARLRELAERLLLQPYPEGPDAVELHAESLPEAVAAEVPVPEDATLLGGALYLRGGRPSRYEAVLEATGDANAFLAAYERTLAELGWGTFEGFGGPHGGFMPSGMMGLGRMFRREEKGPILMVGLVDRAGAPHDVRLRLDWEMARHMVSTPRHEPYGAEKLPPLYPPAGMSLRSQGGGGGGNSWHSEATVNTERPVGELEAHFAGQLQAVGWKRVDGGADAAIAWSSWLVPGDDPWRGVLLVLSPFKTPERALMVRVELTEDGGGGGGGWTGYSSTVALRKG